MKINLSKKQKWVIAAVVALAVVFLVWGCNGAASNEVKVDSVHADTTHVDSLKVDTVGKK